MSLADDVKGVLQQVGVSALGLEDPQLSPTWAAVTPTYNSADLTLDFAADWTAPVAGILSWSSAGAPDVSGLDGNSVSGKVAVLTIHPFAHLRLGRLYASRFGGAAGTSFRPVPVYVVVRVTTIPDPAVVSEVRAADARMPAGRASFHDARGLIIDAAAVAAAFADLLLGFKALATDSSNLATVLTAPGGLSAIAAAAPAGTFLHVVTPHGAPWQDPGAGQGIHSTGGAFGSQRVTGGLFQLPSGASLAPESTATDQPLRLGWATEGTLGSNFTLPAFPTVTPAVSLPRDFIRICAVDLRWHLVGNRTTTTVSGVGPADAVAAAETAPAVRDGCNASYLVDGVEILGHVAEDIAGTSEGFLVAPAIDGTFTFPPHGDGRGRWDAFPATAVTAGAWEDASPKRIRTDGITAAWVNDPNSKDIVVTFAAGVLPAEAHVRVFPRRFLTGLSLTESPTLFRADGDAAIAPAAAQPLSIRLRDPLGLGTTARPSAEARLHFDLLVVPRPAGKSPRARLFGGLNLVVSATPAAPPTAPASSDAFSTVANDHRATCTAPILGLYPASPPSLNPANWGGLTAAQLADVLKQLANEGHPREGPRFPTMARYDSLVAFRTTAGASQSWTATVSGAFLRRETRNAAYRLGNPGGPAGPEIHATGIRCDGQLAYDLGRAAIRRTHFLYDRLVALDANTWNPPAPLTGTVAGAALETIAPSCETPELTLYPVASPADVAALPNTWSDLLQQVGSYLGSLGQQLSQIPGPTNGDRLVAEAKREMFSAQFGRRDAQWALKRAISEARELVYIEAPQFARTADPASAHDYSWDLVAALLSRLQSQRSLRVVISLPKEPTFGRQYVSWAQQAISARSSAIASFPTTSPPGSDPPVGKRLVAFHPMGFPGRPDVIRTTIVIVDDMWCLVGTSVPRRRGFTFDGGTDVVTFDRQLAGGYSSSIRDFRRRLMAIHTGVQAPASGETPTSAWVRLGQPRTAFVAIKELLDQGGRGLIEPLWAGTTGAVAQSLDVADPEGREASALLTFLVGGLAQLETAPT